jgi:hypothetical protein
VGVRAQDDFRAQQRGERRDRGRPAGQRPEEHPDLRAFDPVHRGHVVVERPRGVPVPLGQRHPELDAVQRLGGRGRDLRVADAVPAGHQVQLAGPDHRVRAEAVAVLDLAGEQPAHRLQPGVRVRGDVHRAGAGDLVRAVVVGEAPRADQRPRPLGEGAPDPHGPRAAQRDLARGEDLHGRAVRVGGRRPVATGEFGGGGLGVAHVRHGSRDRRRAWVGGVTGGERGCRWSGGAGARWGVSEASRVAAAAAE